jgi:hypothetical protein
MTRVAIGIVVMCAIAAMAAGCGGGGGGSALTKEDFISQADAICTKYDTEFTNEVEPTYPSVDPTSASTTDEDLKKFEEPLHATHDLRSRQVDELRGLAPPEDFREQWDTVLSDLDTGVEATAEAADAIGDADRAAVEAAFASAQPAFDEADRIVKEYGFKVCGQT